MSAPQDMYVFLSENPLSADFNDRNSLIWEKVGLTYGDWNAGIDGDGTFTHEIEFTPSEVSLYVEIRNLVRTSAHDYTMFFRSYLQNVKNNGSLYVHTYLVQWEKPIENLNQLMSSTEQSVVHAGRRINKYKKRFYVKTQNLLTGETALSEEEIEVREFQCYGFLRVNVPYLYLRYFPESQTDEF